MKDKFLAANSSAVLTKQTIPSGFWVSAECFWAGAEQGSSCSGV